MRDANKFSERASENAPPRSHRRLLQTEWITPVAGRWQTRFSHWPRVRPSADSALVS